MSPPLPTGATETFHKSAHIWENIAFCSYTNKNWKICPLFPKYIRANLRKFVSCPFSPDNQTPMNAPPWAPQKLFFLVFFDMPTQKSTNVINTFQICASFSPKVQTRNSQNQKFQTSQKVPKTVFWPCSLDTGIAPQSSENPIFIVPKWSGQLTNSQVDKLLSLQRGWRWTTY